MWQTKCAGSGALEEGGFGAKVDFLQETSHVDDAMKQNTNKWGDYRISHVPLGAHIVCSHPQTCVRREGLWNYSTHIHQT